MMNFTVIDVIGFIAFATNVWGNLLLVKKNERGWLIRILSILLWGTYGAASASAPVVLNAITFLCINIHGAVSWRRGES